MSGNTDDRRSDRRRASMIGAWIAIGEGFGVALGQVLGNLALGMPIGAALGTAIGALFGGQNVRDALGEAASGRARIAGLVGIGLFLLLLATGVALLLLFAAT
jgi:hypothetical protein